MAEKDKIIRAAEATEPTSEQARTWAAEPETSLEEQLAARKKLIHEQANKITQLQQALADTHAEAARRIEFIEQENAELLAKLDSINRSLAGKLLKGYRGSKDLLLPLGTVRRRLYDQCIIRLRNSPLSVRIRPTAQLESNGQKLSSSHGFTYDSKPRPVIVHYHLFKNAGSTIDSILEKNFGRRLAYLHGQSHDSSVPNTDLFRFLYSNPQIMAVSSHHLRLPKPQNDAFVFFDIIFLRHPLDRLRSMYDFYRQTEMITDPLLEQARRLDLRHFAELLLSGYPHLVNDAQVNFLANGGQYAQAPSDKDLEKAARVATEAAVPGVTELFDLSMRAANHCLHPVFGRLDLRHVKQNVSSGRMESLEARLHHMKQACGSRLFDQLLEMNTLDLQLIEITSNEIQRRLRNAPARGSSPNRADSLRA